MRFETHTLLISVHNIQFQTQERLQIKGRQIYYETNLHYFIKLTAIIM